MRSGLKGEVNLGIEHHAGTDVAQLARELTLKLCAALVAAALLIFGGLVHDAPPMACGLSACTLAALLLAAALLVWAFRPKKKK